MFTSPYQRPSDNESKFRPVSGIANPEYYAQRGISDPRNPMAQLPPPQPKTTQKTNRRSRRNRFNSSSVSSNSYQTSVAPIQDPAPFRGRQGMQAFLTGPSRIVIGNNGKPTFERKTQLNSYGYGDDPYAHMRV